MTDDEYDIHPLDRDYSSDDQPQSRRLSQIATELPYDPKWRRFGVAGLAGGLIVVFLSAIAISNLQGIRPAESIAYGVNRLGMFVMLVGAVLIVLAYRLPYLRGKNYPERFASLFRQPGSYVGLLQATALGYAAVAVLSFLVPATVGSTTGAMLLNFLCTLLFGFMITVAIWHRGFLRAFGVTVAAGVFFQLNFSGWFSYSLVTSGNFNFRPVLLGNLAIVLVSGLICAGYVCLLERKQQGDSDRDI
ncbi:MAG: hypothetical protein HKN47_21065 [Pirellulaceae bacterium]|nr:hypothetical protein [Pirellulaceae bacterium]